MTTEAGAEAGRDADALALVAPGADHTDAEAALLDAGWTRCGAGDWAIALRSPDGRVAARISPFDPVGAYNVALYREAAGTGQVPALFGHRRLAGGGDLQVMELLASVPEPEAVAFTQTVQSSGGELLEVAHRLHDRLSRELPWPGPLDFNPTNVMRRADGRLVMMDLFALDGLSLYQTAETDPDLFVVRFPEHERRFMADIPIATTGGRQEEQMAAIRSAVTAADARRLAQQP
ncbi:hypothetical protein FB381_1837 [Nocardioides albertanoniae]|uniref:Uncharacterized protein n=1 Tax=Nocardioides albertanoniae TaxID=1175486 RepID=A0A543A5V9_9ACTN|nr:hypothetical protein [Nocardioides albertanoniae]TQL67948.1 hypothetical protein FB381_1837 [Nocardioides albertanoniae]